MAEFAAANMPGGEVTFLTTANVTITNKRAVFIGTTYPLAGITSVRIQKEDPSYALLLFGLIVFALGLLFNSASGSAGALFMLAGSGLMILQFVLLKPTFWVRIATAGGEVNAAGYKKIEDAKLVSDALSNAIISRSA